MILLQSLNKKPDLFGGWWHLVGVGHLDFHEPTPMDLLKPFKGFHFISKNTYVRNVMMPSWRSNSRKRCPIPVTMRAIYFFGGLRLYRNMVGFVVVSDLAFQWELLHVFTCSADLAVATNLSLKQFGQLVSFQSKASIWANFHPKFNWVVVWNICLFTPTWEMIQCDEHIFQMGWFNHQLVQHKT